MTASQSASIPEEFESALRHRTKELTASIERLEQENRRLQKENAELSRRLTEAKSGMQTDRAIRRAALNLMEDAVSARQAEERENLERRRIEVELRNASRHKDEFLAILAHELRNPLAPIANGLRLLRMIDNDPQKTSQLQEMLERQVRHMIRLVDDLLDVSRFTTGKIELRIEPVEIANVVRHAVEISQPLIDARQHHLTLNVPQERILVNGDAVRLAQMLANLLCNAAKYTIDGGEIWLNIWREQSEVVISVKDSGEGIDAETLPRLFELFTRGDRSLKAMQGGLGVGLTLVRSLAIAHGGQVEAHSDGIGQGSEFLIRLPLSVEHLMPRVQDSSESNTSLNNLKIMVVDDNRDAADSLTMLLKRLGATVSEAYSGQSALEKVQSTQPAVVLLDIGMPGMDGIEVARRIRELPHGNEIKLFALTGWGQSNELVKWKESGFDDHLIKPVDFKRLLSLLSGISSPTA